MPNINGTQKYLIEATFSFHLDDLADVAEANEAIKALESIKGGANISARDKKHFEMIGIWDTISAVRRILEHPCPQNRSVGDYAAAVGAAGRNPESPELRNGILDGEVYYFINGFGSGVRHEPQGLLGLTSRNDNTADPITKEAVVDYIHHLIDNALANPAILTQRQEPQSCVAPNTTITQHAWVVAINREHQGNGTAIYLEGMGANGWLFLNRFSVAKDMFGIPFVKKESLLRSNFGDNRDFEIFNIDSVQGKTLKRSIRSDISSLRGRLGVSSGSTYDCASTFHAQPRQYYSRAWAINKLRNIVEIDQNQDLNVRQSNCILL